jgi:hypothetical protein
MEVRIRVMWMTVTEDIVLCQAIVRAEIKMRVP